MTAGINQFRYPERTTALLVLSGVSMLANVVNSFVFGGVGFGRFVALVAPVALGVVIHREIGFGNLWDPFLQDGCIRIGLNAAVLYAKIFTDISNWLHKH